MSTSKLKLFFFVKFCQKIVTKSLQKLPKWQKNCHIWSHWLYNQYLEMQTLISYTIPFDFAVIVLVHQEQQSISCSKLFWNKRIEVSQLCSVFVFKCCNKNLGKRGIKFNSLHHKTHPDEKCPPPHPSNLTPSVVLGIRQFFLIFFLSTHLFCCRLYKFISCFFFTSVEVTLRFLWMSSWHWYLSTYIMHLRQNSAVCVGQFLNQGVANIHVCQIFLQFCVKKSNK